MNNTRAASVRKITLTVLGLAIVVIAAANIPVGYSLPALLDNNADAALVANKSQTESKSFKDGWRYTKNGWQNRMDWQAPTPVRKPALHPAVVGSLQLLISLAVLTGFSTSKK